MHQKTIDVCFTVAIHLTREEIEKRFGVNFREGDDYEANYYYNAFTLPRMPVITSGDPKLVQLYKWGLIPFWSKDREFAEKIRRQTFNARSETLHKKPSFKNSLKNKRCLVVARGFFEWQHRNGDKIPHYVYLNEEMPFAFAGLYDSWTDRKTGEILDTFSIITTVANPMMAGIHNSKKRMPAILYPEAEKDWLDTALPDMEAQELLGPFDENLMKAHPISKMITRRGVEKNTPELIQKVSY